MMSHRTRQMTSISHHHRRWIHQVIYIIHNDDDHHDLMYIIWLCNICEGPHKYSNSGRSVTLHVTRSSLTPDTHRSSTGTRGAGASTPGMTANNESRVDGHHSRSHVVTTHWPWTRVSTMTSGWASVSCSHLSASEQLTYVINQYP